MYVARTQLASLDGIEKIGFLRLPVLVDLMSELVMVSIELNKKTSFIKLPPNSP
jgi:hypothetical protein